MNFLRTAAIVAAFLTCTSVHAQWQAPNHSVPLGRGVGVTGFGSAAPGTSGLPLLSGGASADPAFGPGGIDANVLNSQTSTYPLVASDCGKTVVLGGSAFFTLTVGAASGFPATCSVVVVNNDAGRGKKMAINGVTFPNNSILWPKQTFTLKNEANAWVVVNAPGRWKLASAVQFEVNSAAADNSGDGLATGAANAFKTINGAIGVISSVVDQNGTGLTLHTDCTAPPVTYTESIRLLPIVGQPIGNRPSNNLNPQLVGDNTTPANCILTSSNGATVQAIGGTYWNIKGFQLKNTDGSSPCILSDQQSWLRAGNMDFNSCNGASGNHIVVENMSGYEPMEAYTVSAGASSHVFSTLQGLFVYGGAFAVTLTGTPAFPGGFVNASRNSLQLWTGATFSGAATGPRYNTITGSGLETNGGGANFFPGNSAGTATAPGWYN